MKLLMLVVSLMILVMAGPTYSANVMLPREKVIDSISQLIGFFETNLDHLIFDGLFGLRPVVGALDNILHVHGTLEEPYKSYYALYQRIETVTDTGIRQLEVNNDPTLKVLKPLLEKSYWAKHRKDLKVDLQRYKWERRKSDKQSMEEYGAVKSDNCIFELMNSTDTVCKISDSCVDLIVNRRLQGYPLQHQILYSQIATNLMAACRSVWDQLLEKRGFKDHDEFELEWCTNSYVELQAITSKGSPATISADLDLIFEMLFACAVSGYGEFLKPEYLELVVSTQDKSGCWKDILVKDDHIFQRKLKTEEQLGDGCLYHETAVAASALSQFLLLYHEPHPEAKLLQPHGGGFKSHPMQAASGSMFWTVVLFTLPVIILTAFICLRTPRCRRSIQKCL